MVAGASRVLTIGGNTVTLSIDIEADVCSPDRCSGDTMEGMVCMSRDIDRDGAFARRAISREPAPRPCLKEAREASAEVKFGMASDGSTIGKDVEGM